MGLKMEKPDYLYFDLDIDNCNDYNKRYIDVIFQNWVYEI